MTSDIMLIGLFTIKALDFVSREDSGQARHLQSLCTKDVDMSLLKFLHEDSGGC